MYCASRLQPLLLVIFQIHTYSSINEKPYVPIVKFRYEEASQFVDRLMGSKKSGGDLKTVNMGISTLAKLGKVEDVFTLVEKMRCSGMQPDIFSYGGKFMENIISCFSTLAL